MLELKVKCFNIDYCVEEEDVDDLQEERGIDEDDYDSIENLVQEVKESLPKEVILKVWCDDEDDFEDELVDELTDETGWLINGFQYDIIK